MAFIWNTLKMIPVVGKIFRVMELLAKITAELVSTQSTLVKMQKKASGSVTVAIISAIGAVAFAITAVAAATADPEPVTKFALVVSAIAAIALALIAIAAIFDAIETSQQADKLEEEMTELRKEQDKLNDLLRELKGECSL
jgi:uncharacterized membrane protein